MVSGQCKQQIRIRSTSARHELGSRLMRMQAEQQRLKAANSIAIIGGGPVGVEVAAEILTDLPGASKIAADAMHACMHACMRAC
jgi:NADH dehydrogenase FAD-containing subunit